MFCNEIAGIITETSINDRYLIYQDLENKIYFNFKSLKSRLKGPVLKLFNKLFKFSAHSIEPPRILDILSIWD